MTWQAPPLEKVIVLSWEAVNIKGHLYKTGEAWAVVSLLKNLDTRPEKKEDIQTFSSDVSCWLLLELGIEEAEM